MDKVVRFCVRDPLDDAYAKVTEHARVTRANALCVLARVALG
jgi:hypothetical protein